VAVRRHLVAPLHPAWTRMPSEEFQAGRGIRTPALRGVPRHLGRALPGRHDPEPARLGLRTSEPAGSRGTSGLYAGRRPKFRCGRTVMRGSARMPPA